MSNRVNATIASGIMTIFVDGDIYSIPLESKHARKIGKLVKSAVKNGTDKNINKLREALDIKQALEEDSIGRFKVRKGVIYKDGKRLDNAVSAVVKKFFDQGLAYEPLVLFLDKLYNNTSMRSIQSLYNFISKWPTFQITNDGDFIAYKGVTSDFMDIHSKSVSNKPGEVPPRFQSNEVDDDPNNGCSYGYHAGSIEYACSWAGCAGKVVRVKINPADVRCVPYDSNYQKIRCLGYEVLEEVCPEEVQRYLEYRYELFGHVAEEEYNPYEDCMDAWHDIIEENEYVQELSEASEVCEICSRDITYSVDDVYYVCDSCHAVMCSDCVITVPNKNRDNIDLCENCIRDGVDLNSL